MKRDEIIRMAIEAELVPDALWETPELKRFAELVAAAERDACVKDVLSIANDDAGNPYKQALRIGAEAIRARGQKESA